MTRDKGSRDNRWYLSIMAPNTKGNKFAWLDPTSIYINGEAFNDLLDDLVADLDHADVVGDNRDLQSTKDRTGFRIDDLRDALAGVDEDEFVIVRQADRRGQCLDVHHFVLRLSQNVDR